MSIAITLVLGLLIGWLIEWVIDWFYWRRPKREPASENSAVATSAPTPDSSVVSTSLPDSFAIMADAEEVPPAEPDDLTVIKGIGPVISKRLNEAGVYTYEQLAGLTQDEFEQALGHLLERFINERSILRQARELAAKKKAG